MHAMTDDQPLDWRKLWDISFKLTSNSPPLRAAFPWRGALDAAIGKAISSGKVPVRGKRGNAYDATAAFGTGFERIEPGPRANIDISLNRLIVLSGEMLGLNECFLEVEADYTAVKRWLLVNALPSGGALDECGFWLAMLPEHPRLTKGDAAKKFRVEHGSIGDNAFDRAWNESAHLSWRNPGRPRGK
jgi:hypothetical protein